MSVATVPLRDGDHKVLGHSFVVRNLMNPEICRPFLQRR